MKPYKENPNRKVYNIDFDGTLTDGEYISDPRPMKTIINQVESLYRQGNIIIIWTARQWNEAPFLIGWLEKHSVPYHGVMMGKGGSDIYVDDKMMGIGEFMLL